MDEYDEARFKAKVKSALERVRTILDNEREPSLPENVLHEYGDLYALAETLARTSITACARALQHVGASESVLQELSTWSSITMRFDVIQKVDFREKVERKEVDPTERTITAKGMFGSLSTTESVIRRITEYFWNFSCTYELKAFRGADPDDHVVLFDGHCNRILKTLSEEPPAPPIKHFAHHDVDITWLSRMMCPGAGSVFCIDRTDPQQCRTPRRNPDVERLLEVFTYLHTFCGKITGYFESDLFSWEKDTPLDLSKMNPKEVFVPAQPVFDERRARNDECTLSDEDVSAFLDEQRRSLEAKCASIHEIFPEKEDGQLISRAEAKGVMIFNHIGDICTAYSNGVSYIEGMLRTKLITAIGKEIGAPEFIEYMAFHNRKLFKEPYRPVPFSYAIRRVDQAPQGVIAIESSLHGAVSLTQPISTLVHHQSAGARSMSVEINDSTCVNVNGETFVHGWMAHQFSSSTGQTLQLTARARQFSSMILMVGRITGANSFDVKHAIMLQNKDELVIPLLCETIPSPKEFADAIKSLSPEQQRFATAFRSMQLQGTLIGIAVVQVTPLLERVLNLPRDSLTQEIELREHLIELFLKYQIPSDQLSYDGDPASDAESQVQTVRRYVGNLQSMIQDLKEEQLQDARDKGDYAKGMSLGGDIEDCLNEDYDYSDEDCDGDDDWGGSCSEVRGGYCTTETKSLLRLEKHDVSRICDEPVEPCEADALEGNARENIPEETGETDAETLDISTQGDAPSVGGDLTTLPKALDSALSRLDVDNAVRPTTIKIGEFWTLRRLKFTSQEHVQDVVDAEGQSTSRESAMDLLDALTRSGKLAVEHSSMHVILAATHAFEKTLIDTVVQDNVNPIEPVERSMIIMASIVHGEKAGTMICEEQLDRVRQFSSKLLEESASME